MNDNKKYHHGEAGDNETWPETVAPSSPGPTVNYDKHVNTIKSDCSYILSVDGFEIIGRLGAGGMGTVYKARRHADGCIVALKIMGGDIVGEHDWYQRFQLEALAVAKLQHPNIVQVHDGGLSQGVPWMSMEYMQGGSLDRRRRESPPTFREAAELVAKLSDAVEHAHSRGILHRDLKPANILLTEDGTPKIGDFGLAKHLEKSREIHGTVMFSFHPRPKLPSGSTSGNYYRKGGVAGTLLNSTDFGIIMGSPRYMSPEQALGAGVSGEIGPPTDRLSGNDSL